MATHETQGIAAWQRLTQIPEFPIDVSRSALIVIDMTYSDASRQDGLIKQMIDEGYGDDLRYYLDRIENLLVPTIARLIAAFRTKSAPVIYTRCASLRGDGSDQTWRHRNFNLACPTDAKTAQVIDALKPEPNDIVLVKTGSGVFNSTNLEHLLRNMGITTLFMTGIYTNSCVETAIRDAGDLDFRVILVDDACAAMSPLGDRTAREYLDKNFCHVKSSNTVLELIGVKDSSLPVAPT